MLASLLFLGVEARPPPLVTRLVHLAESEEEDPSTQISVHSEEFTSLIYEGLLETEQWWDENVPLTYEEDLDAIYDELVTPSDNEEEIRAFQEALLLEMTLEFQEENHRLLEPIYDETI